ncbi:MAG: hypothetical protein A3C43_10450 [Candidatus Schekmanbacteria bacterium RIFCSPHIGHO2_02_FULL_38_11]|nr:MAG: hypothetical protein A3C43_10450 [Candidatus Schekmanbacteria bacterium RIFCSPHIGHO2_02_FULL_38_11]
MNSEFDEKGMILKKNKAGLKINYFFIWLVLLSILPLNTFSQTIEDEKQAVPSFVLIARDIKPSVVNIYTTKPLEKGNLEIRGKKFKNKFWINDLPDKDIDKPFDDSDRRNLGSGIIIDKDGYIVTNNHVIANADDIKVSLEGGKEFDAKIIGKDFITDLALIKIDKAENLTVPRFGDSDKIDVGEWVMAIGSPVGLEQTVTAGIVSAKNRSIGVSPYDDFIQTDASTNPGSSGGPLINTRGEVIGINTLNLNGLQGLGFAIPTNTAKEIIKQLKENGKVTRGWLGVLVPRILQGIKALSGLQDEKGAYIEKIRENGPAFKAGLKAGDVIVKFNGREIKEKNDLPRMVADTTPGEEVDVEVLRDGEEKILKVKIEESEGRKNKKPGETENVDI